MTDGADQCQLIVEKAAELQVGSESPEDVPLRLKHKFGDVIETTGRIRIVGTDSVRIIALNLKLTEAAKAGILTVTYGGKMTFFNANALSILGFPEKDMLKMTLDDIIPAPYGLLHSMWVRRKNLSSTQAGSCRNGRYVQVQGRNGRLIPVALTVRDGEVTAAEAHHKGASEHPQTYTIRLAPIPSETLTFYGRCQVCMHAPPHTRRGPDKYMHTSPLLNKHPIRSDDCCAVPEIPSTFSPSNEPHEPPSRMQTVCRGPRHQNRRGARQHHVLWL